MNLVGDLYMGKNKDTQTKCCSTFLIKVHYINKVELLDINNSNNDVTIEYILNKYLGAWKKLADM